ncbi:MAG: hypothetical protein DIKNOCCD_01362 [bacterium]|nr:hypothetical protein [bacterium]
MVPEQAGNQKHPEQPGGHLHLRILIPATDAAAHQAQGQNRKRPHHGSKISQSTQVQPGRSPWIGGEKAVQQGREANVSGIDIKCGPLVTPGRRPITHVFQNAEVIKIRIQPIPHRGAEDQKQNGQDCRQKSPPLPLPAQPDQQKPRLHFHQCRQADHRTGGFTAAMPPQKKNEADQKQQEMVQLTGGDRPEMRKEISDCAE